MMVGSFLLNFFMVYTSTIEGKLQNLTPLIDAFSFFAMIGWLISVFRSRLMSLPICVQELGATGSDATLKVKFANRISSMDPDHNELVSVQARIFSNSLAQRV